MRATTRYFRIMLGWKSKYAEKCLKGGFIGGHWDFDTDLSNDLPEDWRDFNKKFIPIYLAAHPGKTRVAAGLACGMLHTICRGIAVGDVVICPDGSGKYHVGEVASQYQFAMGGILPHRRIVIWSGHLIDREEMSPELRSSVGSSGTVAALDKHASELVRLIAGVAASDSTGADQFAEDPVGFALEKHLEEFLVQNWAATELGKRFRLFEEEGEVVGQQYPTDTGPIDILAISKDGKELVVVELKRGRASDTVVGQVQRYMGYVMDELAEPGQTVRGIIIAMEDDKRIRRALSVTSNIDFYRYRVSFALDKVIAPGKS